ncbi:hypothetical protein K1K55_004074 [Salmonella enterica]|nr:hypothetical protein [Salmonella enterica]
MVITQNDVKNDLHMLVGSINDGSKQLAKPIEALKISMLWPLSSVAGYLLSMLWLSITYQSYVNHFDNVVTLLDEYGFAIGFGAISIVFSLFIGFALYGQAIAYLSLGKEARDNSIIIDKLKRLISKLGFLTFFANVLLAVATIYIPDLLVGAPLMLMFSFIVMQMIISAEISRYGLGVVLGKINKIVEKL